MIGGRLTGNQNPYGPPPGSHTSATILGQTTLIGQMNYERQLHLRRVQDMQHYQRDIQPALSQMQFAQKAAGFEKGIFQDPQQSFSAKLGNAIGVSSPFFTGVGSTFAAPFMLGMGIELGQMVGVLPTEGRIGGALTKVSSGVNYVTHEILGKGGAAIGGALFSPFTDTINKGLIQPALQASYESRVGAPTDIYGQQEKFDGTLSQTLGTANTNAFASTLAHTGGSLLGLKVASSVHTASKWVAGKMLAQGGKATTIGERLLQSGGKFAAFSKSAMFNVTSAIGVAAQLGGAAAQYNANAQSESQGFYDPTINKFSEKGAMVGGVLGAVGGAVGGLAGGPAGVVAGMAQGWATGSGVGRGLGAAYASSGASGRLRYENERAYQTANLSTKLSNFAHTNPALFDRDMATPIGRGLSRSKADKLAKELKTMQQMENAVGGDLTDTQLSAGFSLAATGGELKGAGNDPKEMARRVKSLIKNVKTMAKEFGGTMAEGYKAIQEMKQSGLIDKATSTIPGGAAAMFNQVKTIGTMSGIGYSGAIQAAKQGASIYQRMGLEGHGGAMMQMKNTYFAQEYIDRERSRPGGVPAFVLAQMGGMQGITDRMTMANAEMANSNYGNVVSAYISKFKNGEYVGLDKEALAKVKAGKVSVAEMTSKTTAQFGGDVEGMTSWMNSAQAKANIGKVDMIGSYLAKAAGVSGIGRSKGKLTRFLVSQRGMDTVTAGAAVDKWLNQSDYNIDEFIASNRSSLVAQEQSFGPRLGGGTSRWSRIGGRALTTIGDNFNAAGGILNDMLGGIGMPISSSLGKTLHRGASYVARGAYGALSTIGRGWREVGAFVGDISSEVGKIASNFLNYSVDALNAGDYVTKAIDVGSSIASTIDYTLGGRAPSKARWGVKFSGSGRISSSTFNKIGEEYGQSLLAAKKVRTKIASAMDASFRSKVSADVKDFAKPLGDEQAIRLTGLLSGNTKDKTSAINEIMRLSENKVNKAAQYKDLSTSQKLLKAAEVSKQYMLRLGANQEDIKSMYTTMKDTSIEKSLKIDSAAEEKASIDRSNRSANTIKGLLSETADDDIFGGRSIREILKDSPNIIGTIEAMVEGDSELTQAKVTENTKTAEMMSSVYSLYRLNSNMSDKELRQKLAKSGIDKKAGAAQLYKKLRTLKGAEKTKVMTLLKQSSVKHTEAKKRNAKQTMEFMFGSNAGLQKALDDSKVGALERGKISAKLMELTSEGGNITAKKKEFAELIATRGIAKGLAAGINGVGADDVDAIYDNLSKGQARFRSKLSNITKEAGASASGSTGSSASSGGGSDFTEGLTKAIEGLQAMKDSEAFKKMAEQAQ